MGEPATVDLAAAEFWSDPHPILNAARERCAVAQESFRALLDRFSDIHSPLTELEWVPFASSRRIQRLPLVLKPG